MTFAFCGQTGSYALRGITTPLYIIMCSVKRLLRILQGSLVGRKFVGISLFNSGVDLQYSRNQSANR
jgi:hypothetical protein